MARAKSPTKIIEDELKALGEKAYEDARATSKVSADRFNKDGQQVHEGGSLVDSINYYPKGKKLTMSQLYYGQFNTPKGESTPAPREGEKFNALRISIAKHIPESVNVISKNLLKTILSK